MAKSSKRIINSYEAYLRYRESWGDKGYGLDRKLTLNEYAQVHRSLSHAGEQHIARTVAGNERTFTRSEGAAIARKIKNAEQYSEVDKEMLSELQKKYRRGKDIYGLQLTPQEELAQETRRREALLARNVKPQYTIQANARAKLFDELRDAGLSYKDAEAVLYG